MSRSDKQQQSSLKREEPASAHGGQQRARQYATFFLEDHFLGVEVVTVQEVLTALAMTRVPLAPPVVAGLLNLRGQIVTAIDLRTRLGFARREDGSSPVNVVVQTEHGPVSLLVDRIGDVIEVSPDLCEAPAETVDPRLREVTVGIYKLKDRLLLALDTELVVRGIASAA